MSTRRSAVAGTLALVIALGGCASAGKRLEQGLEDEASGDYLQAAFRYADAVDKDASLTEARERLRLAADSAFAVRMRRAEDPGAIGGALVSAAEMRDLDRLMARADEVGVLLTSPRGYPSLRRTTFDRAIDDLMARARDEQISGSWSDARASYQRIRRNLEPSAAQHTLSIESEAALLLEWAEVEESRGRLRGGFDLAGEALALSPRLPDAVAEPAADLQDRTLAMGTRALVVFPVTATRPAREEMQSDLDSELSDLLELDYWRNPPLFVVVADPVAVRQATRRFRGERGYRPERIMEEVGADFGASVEVTLVQAVHQNAKGRTRDARTADGEETTYVEEESTLLVTLEARVIVHDIDGDEIGDFSVRSSANGRLRRGVYRGDPRNLELSRNEMRLFDADYLRQQRAAVESDAVVELAERVANRVFSRVLSRIP